MTDKRTSPTPDASDESPNESDAESTPLDRHGHNPDDYDWVPVLRKRRKDGWTPERQRAFIGALADTGEVIAAAQSVGMSDSSAYTLRRAPGAEGFAAAWEAALGNSSGRLVDIAFDRAINGVDDVVLDKEGNHIYTKRKYNDRLLMFLIRAHGPARYCNAHRQGSADGEAQLTVPAQMPVAEALKLLGPEPPAEPEKLLSPEELDDAIEIADIMDGKLPHWQRQDRIGDEEQADGPPEFTRLTPSELYVSDNEDNSDEKE